MSRTTVGTGGRAAARGRWHGATTACGRVARGAATEVARRVDALRGRASGRPGDAGLATAEYAIVLIAAVGFAGLLVVILSSGEVREALTSLVRSALTV